MHPNLPVLDTVIIREHHDLGWRGLTGRGEVLMVTGGRPGEAPSYITIMRKGQPVGQYVVPPDCANGGGIQSYLDHFKVAIELFKQNRFEEALVGINKAIMIAPTTRARFNRGLILLSLRRWTEGLADHELRLDLFMPQPCHIAAAIMPRWQGEDLHDKRLLLVHDAGYGDTIMTLRHVPALQRAGAAVQLLAPPVLHRFAAHVVPMMDKCEADFYCPTLSLPHLLKQTISSVACPPYLYPTRMAVLRWQQMLGAPHGRRIGIAWSVGTNVEGDYPRAIGLHPLVNRLREIHGEVELYSVQVQDAEAAVAFGVKVPPLKDFEDCAALMELMDEIVTIDTAAVHVAGSIGHPKISLLLSYWASWRWLAPLYDNVHICQQDVPDDWDGALAKLIGSI